MATEPGAMDKDQQIEELRKAMAEKDEKLKAMEERLKEKENENMTTEEGAANDNEAESKSPPKTDVTLSLRGIPEYDSYPYSLKADRFLFMASVKAPYFRSEQRAPIDLVAVVDESGSMGGERITLVRETVKFIIKNLENGDRFGIVGYSNGAREVLPLTTMDEAGRDRAVNLTNGLRASGGTALCAGLVLGVNMMRNRTTKNEVASVMLLTDGQANQGPTSAPQIISCVKSGSVVGGRHSFTGYGQQNVQIQPNLNLNMNRKPKKRQKAPQFQQMLNMQRQTVQIQGQPPLAPPGPPAPPPVPQSAQGVQGQVISEENEVDEKSTAKYEDELPCTINTFGFGAGHNENLLEAIAENGRGMYAFIKNTEMIGDTFAECLGGLVSIIGQNLVIKVEALNDVEITQCLSTGYSLNVTKPRKVHEVRIKDLQSEENRELMFELKVPSIATEKEKDPIIQLAVSYDNVVKERNETLSNVCCVDRVSGKQIGERNMELDLQYNRVLAANAMEEADKLANGGQLDAARKVLCAASKTIGKSKSNANTFSKNLVKDIQSVESNMQSKHQYASQGGKMLKMNKKAHMWQRSVQSSNYASQSAYVNCSKSKMKKKFKGSK